jgi:4-alpha-glucanotransferase
VSGPGGSGGSGGLRTLAGLHGIELRHTDGFGTPVEVADETLLALLQALGVPIESPEQAPEAAAEVRREREGRLTEPVVVAWDGGAPDHPPRRPQVRRAWRLTLESGEEQSGEASFAAPAPSAPPR